MAGNFTLVALTPTDDAGWVGDPVAVTPVSDALATANAIQESDIGTDSWATLTAHKAYAQEVIDMTTAPEDLVTYAAAQLNATVSIATENNGCVYAFDADDTAVEALSIPDESDSGTFVSFPVTAKMMPLDSGRRFRQDLTGSGDTFGAANETVLPTSGGQVYVFRLSTDVRNLGGLSATFRVAGMAFKGASGYDVNLFFRTLQNDELAGFLDQEGDDPSQFVLGAPSVAEDRITVNVIVVVSSSAVRIFDETGQTQLGNYIGGVGDFTPVLYVNDIEAAYSGAQVEMAVSNPSESFLTGEFETALYLCSDPGDPGEEDEEDPIDVDARDLDVVTNFVAAFSEKLGTSSIGDPITGSDYLLSIGHAISVAIARDDRAGDTAAMDVIKAEFQANTNGAYSYEAMGRWACFMKSARPEATNFLHSMLRVVYEDIDPGNLPEWLEEANFDTLCKYMSRSLVEKRLWYLTKIR